MIRVLPSIASADPLALRDEIARVRNIGRLHLDIEDGNFIDNITFGKKTVVSITKEFDGELDVHLMVKNPESYLDWLSAAGIQAVCAQIESLPYPKRFLNHARSLGMRAGLAFNMKVRPEELIPYASDLDYVLIMTSEPDYADQSFCSCSYERVSCFRNILPKDREIWCDGGICPHHLQALSSAGMNVAVMGRAVFSSPDPETAVSEYERSVF